MQERCKKGERIAKEIMAQITPISNEQLLDNLQLFNNGNLTRAAILLFHHKPEKWVPGAYIKIAFFANDSDIIYQDEVHGSLMYQAESTVDLIYLKYLKGLISFSNITRVESYPYPKEAIREAVLNAIAHKNYATLTPIQIRVYEDKIIIANDCVFPEDWTMEDLLGPHKSRPYNPLIANALFRAGFIEAWGRGIQTIKNHCDMAGNDAPVYNIKRDEIAVSFKASKMYIDLLALTRTQSTAQTAQTTAQTAQTTTQSAAQTAQIIEPIYTIEERIIIAIQENPKYSQRAIAEWLGETHATIRYHLSKMQKQGRIEYNGTGRKGTWFVKL